ncbi:transcriptional regulator [Chitinophaga caeni]|uniref:Transcriptional regulator n=1 Tax=Chitinophaga caeni TaxID=2029983 RepID=A0A291QXM5_9BACT|nr:metalloregulator ArsR/SmtB family transcription factor [Chitinophaga caeni]ATL48698.1 transcriptional regulator [Chitinophaga caeni]
MSTQQLDVFQVVADPSRRTILQMLSEDSMSINTIAENFEMSRPAVSKHIKILNQAGFISIEDIGRERYCTLKQDGFRQLQDWMQYFDQFWHTKLNKLARLLDERPSKDE